MKKEQVSIILCTRNQATSLRKTIEEIGKVVVPVGWEVELLIVDNGSTDQTREIVEQTRISNMPVRWIHEPRTGKGYAYNSGMAAAGGDVFLFTDDDVRVPRDWIEGMCRPILKGEADAVGGGVRFPDDYLELFQSGALRSRKGWFASTAAIDPDRPDRMVGANMAFHRRVADCLGGFDTALGPGALGFGDETLVSRRLLDEGFRLVSAFDVSVEHQFDRQRATPPQLLVIAERMGRSEGYLAHHWLHCIRPELKDVIRVKAGLMIRRLFCPSSWWDKSAHEWEVGSVERVAFVAMCYSLRNETPKYQRHSELTRTSVPSTSEDFHWTGKKSAAGETRADVSIVVATRNRALALAKTLESLGTVALPEHCMVEVILIDNGSTDATRDVIAGFRPMHLKIRSVTEPIGGKSRALNTGISVAKGRVLLFTDDDVRFPPDWIAKMTDPILKGDVDAVAGGVHLAGHLQRPWMGPMHRGWLADVSIGTTGLQERPYLVGANMAIRRSVILRFGGFDTALGPGAAGFGEDGLLSLLFWRDGIRTLQLADCAVEHHPDPSRLSYSAFVSMAQRMGESGAYLAHHYEQRSVRLVRTRYWKHRLALALYRLGKAPPVEGITEKEADLISSVAHYARLARESRLPRHYGPKGNALNGAFTSDSFEASREPVPANGQLKTAPPCRGLATHEQ